MWAGITVTTTEHMTKSYTCQATNDVKCAIYNGMKRIEKYWTKRR